MDLKNKKLINISEASRLIGLVDKNTGKPLTHTLRYWESKFKQIKPTILSGNRRYYSVKDIEILKLIIFLLKKHNLTIEGAKNLMNKELNTLDDFISSSIKAKYHKDKIKSKIKNILDKIRKLNGKKNAY